MAAVAVRARRARCEEGLVFVCFCCMCVKLPCVLLLATGRKIERDGCRVTTPNKKSSGRPVFRGATFRHRSTHSIRHSTGRHAAHGREIVDVDNEQAACFLW